MVRRFVLGFLTICFILVPATSALPSAEAAQRLPGLLLSAGGATPGKGLTQLGSDGLTTLRGSLLPSLHRLRRLHPLAAGSRLPVALSLRVRHQGALLRFLHEVYDPASPIFHRFLTPNQFAARFGATRWEQNQIVGWLQSSGLHVTQRFRNGLLITAWGNEASMERVFHTPIYWYRTPSRTFFANAKPVQLPVEVAAVVAGVSGLTSFSRQRARGRLRPHRSGAGSGPLFGYTPQQMARVYNISPLYQQGASGQGQTIAIVAHSDFNPDHIAAFDQQFGISSTVERVSVTNGNEQGTAAFDSQTEVEMDTEIVQGIAPAAHVLVYEAGNTSVGMVSIYNQIAADGRAQVASTSYGNSENEFDPADLTGVNAALREAAAQGQAIFAASGDNGAYDDAQTPTGNPQALTVDFPASDPWVTGVGGTTMVPAEDGSHGTETVWSDPPRVNGSGGGLSSVYQRPAYQIGPGVSNGYSNGMRQVPDVAADADPSTGCAIYTVDGPDHAGWVEAAGTSASAPIWAGYTALLNQKLGHPVGFFNPLLYALGQQAETFDRKPFHDITVGTNLYYPATPGWDFATGWGSFDGAALLDDLKVMKPAPTPTSTPVPTSPPTPAPSPTPQAQIGGGGEHLTTLTLRARLWRPTVRRGQEERMTLQTAVGAAVLLHVQYPRSGGFSVRGTADSSGVWQHRWIVRAGRAGRATLRLTATKDEKKSSLTLHFAIR